MDVIPNDLLRASLDARERLSSYARQTAIADLHGNFSAMQGAMAGAAHEAIFADALLQAMHARLEEFRTVSKA